MCFCLCIIRITYKINAAYRIGKIYISKYPSVEYNQEGYSMNAKSRIVLYLLGYSYLIMEIIKIWGLKYDGINTGLPIYLLIPFLPISIGFIIDLINISRENEENEDRKI